MKTTNNFRSEIELAGEKCISLQDLQILHDEWGNKVDLGQVLLGDLIQNLAKTLVKFFESEGDLNYAINLNKERLTLILQAVKKSSMSPNEKNSYIEKLANTTFVGKKRNIEQG